MEVGTPRERSDQAMKPAKYRLATPHLASAPDPEAERLQAHQQCRRRNVHEVAGKVEREPRVPERARLQTRCVGQSDDHQSVGQQ